MLLNIKNERVTQLALAIAAETGESITDAVGRALQLRLGGLRCQKARLGVAKRLMELGRRCVDHAPSDWLTKDFKSEFYDDRELPR